jgi:ubiquinone/menaquinone biosynthesis C-methylase UbiE
MASDGARIERFKRGVREEWQHPQVAVAYRKWDRDESEWGRAARELILRRASLAPGQSVLDLGSGHGEPGLAIAQIVGQTGHVTLTDINAELLEISKERARFAGLGNVTTKVADAHELPFRDSTFDRLTCRFAAMYFADHAQAFREARRVLKPGGAAAYLAWGGFDQPIFRDIVGVLFQHVTPPEDEPGAPSPFKFAEPGVLTRALREVGFVDVEEETTTVPTSLPGGPERWWTWFVDMAVPLQSLVASLSDNDRQKALAAIHDALRPFHDGEAVRVPIDVLVASARKGA